MKRKKEISTILFIISLVLIISGILFDLFNNDTKNLLSIEDVKISKKSSYEQNVYYRMLGLEDMDARIHNGQISIYDLGLPFYKDYSSCSGNVNFSNNKDFKNWYFNTSCIDKDSDSVDLKFNVFDTMSSDLEIVDMKKVKQGYLVMASENKEFSSKSYVMVLNDNLEVLWQSNVQDSTDTTLKTYIYDGLEVSDGYYILGYASNSVLGDFNGISTTDSEFSFLVKYDTLGRRVSIKKITTSRMYEFLGYYNDKVYVMGHDDIFVVGDSKIESIIIPDDVLIFGMNDKYFYGYSSEDLTYRSGVKGYGAKIEVLNLDGTRYFSKSTTRMKKCSVHSPCSITSIVGNNDNLLVTVDDQLYVMNYDGKVKKRIDYSKIKLNGEVIDTLKFDDLLMLDNSYVVISNPTTPHVMVEEYDFDHNLLYRKTYYFDSIQLLYGASEEFKWFYSDNTLYRAYTFIEGRNSFVTWSVK